MRKPSDIRKDIRDLKRYMKANGLKVTSFMNRQASMGQARANEMLFALKVELDQSTQLSKGGPP